MARGKRRRRTWSALAVLPLAAASAAVIHAEPAHAEQSGFSASGQQSLTFTAASGSVVTCTASWAAFKEPHDGAPGYRTSAHLRFEGPACRNNWLFAEVRHRPSGAEEERAISEVYDATNVGVVVDPAGTVSAMHFHARFDNCHAQRCWLDITYTAPK